MKLKHLSSLVLLATLSTTLSVFAALEAPFSIEAIEAERGRLEREQGLPAMYTDGAGKVFALIPAGTFTMGSAPADLEIAAEHKPGWWNEAATKAQLDPETPAHRVTISKPFYMRTTPVTIGDFRKFVEATGYETLAERDGEGGMYYDNGAQRGPEIIWSNPRPGRTFSDTAPVTQVAPEDVAAYAKWLSEKEGVTYRLPTEAEWEYAARGGTDTVWYWGNDASAFGEHAHRGAVPAPVGERKPNPFGLHDIYGNVWEWCSDWFDPALYSEEARVDPTGPEAGDKYVRRGGTFGTGPTQSRSAFRKGSPADYQGLHVGFRLVREIP